MAIIGVETFYGRNTGSHRVIDALSTLGFDYPPRQPFFRQQLKEFLLLTREEQVDPLTLKGLRRGHGPAAVHAEQLPRLCRGLRW